MIHYQTAREDGNWGVSYNENGIILHVDSFDNTDRILLSPKEVEQLILELKTFEREHLREKEADPQKPIHFLKKWHDSIAVCGAEYPFRNATTIYSKVTCKKCVRTKAFKNGRSK